MRLSFISSLALSSVALSAPVSDASLSARADAPWDIIVVGAGPAGIIVADRLSEAGKKTLLIEEGGASYSVTGGNDKPAWLSGTQLSRVDVPGLYSSIFSKTSNMLCGGKTNAFGGCTLGGSSAINAGLFFQPPASDWDQNPVGWKASDLNSATSKLKARQPSSDITSADGVRYLQTSYNAVKQWLVTGAGYRELDINGNANSKTKVFGHPIFDYNKGQRGGPVTNYLQTALKRSNFKLQSGVRVQRVVRNGDTATGVVATINGFDTTIPLAAKGRVILSGGALQSPALLMRSAIGDPATLTRLANANKLGGLASSKWINNTAIGAQLFDNPNTFIELSSPNVNAYTYNYDNPPAGSKEEYLSSKGKIGPYTLAGQTAVFWDSVARPDGSHAGMQGTISSSGYSEYTDSHTITLNIYGTSGLKSTGTVVLDNSFVPGPDGNVYYSNPQDAQDIATYIRRIFDALPKSTLKPLNISPSATVEQIRTYITTGSAYARGQVNHWSSSCRFNTCVDANVQIKGTKNIHVVDGSIVPPLTVNPQMGIMIAAERSSELILKLA